MIEYELRLCEGLQKDNEEDFAIYDYLKELGITFIDSDDMVWLESEAQFLKFDSMLKFNWFVEKVGGSVIINGKVLTIYNGYYE